MKIPVGLQLYTLRDKMEEDFLGTLKKVAEIGYKGVEFFSFGGYSAKELKEYLKEIGLEVLGAHVQLDDLKNNLEEVIKYNLELGNPYIVCSWAKFSTKEEYLKLAEDFNRIGMACNKAGLRFCYHNHDHEFETFDGEYALDIIYGQVSSENLMAEIDAYWITHAGVDPIEYMKKYSGRTPLVHIKDIENNETKDFTEIGSGIIDIESIAKQAKESGAEWLIVEQDTCKIDGIDSVRISFENLKKMNLV